MMQRSHDGDFASVAHSDVFGGGFLEHLSFVQRSYIYINNSGAYLHFTIIYVHHKRLAKLSSRNRTMNFASLLILTSAFIKFKADVPKHTLSIYYVQ